MTIHTIAPGFLQHYYPLELVSAIAALQKKVQYLYLAGGAVRDLLLGGKPIDLDFAVGANAIEAAQFFALHINGKFVLLDESEEVARVVWKNYCLDFTSFRQKTKDIKEDLRLRDFTINAMAYQVSTETPDLIATSNLIDPCNGLDDLQKGIIKYTHDGAFTNDPLRILRAYRFGAIYGYRLEAETAEAIRRDGKLLKKVSPERVSSELHKIMVSNRARDCFKHMDDWGVLAILFPEIAAGKNVQQPGSHHLDVFEHNLAALGELEKIIAENTPEDLGLDAHEADYLKDRERMRRLKWASFFHDLGKPSASKIRDGRITFYGHDNTGSEQFVKIAQRLKWSRLDTDLIARFIKHHMWLFHLTNAQKKTGIKPKACLKIHKALGAELTGLYLLSLADSLAAKGADKPEGMEKRLQDLYLLIRQVIKERVDPVLSRPPVLSGKDLISHFQLTPGPLFKKILLSLEKEQVTRGQMTKEAALDWVENYLRPSKE